MRLLSTFIPQKLFRNKSFILDAANNKAPRKSTFITLLSGKREDIADIFNMPLFNKRYLRSIYVEKLYRAKMITGAMKTVRQKVSEIYKKHKEQMRWLQFYFLMVEQYHERNIIYDASTRLQLLERSNFVSIQMYIRQCYAIFDSILQDARFSSYTKKYFVVNIDESIKVDIKYIMKPQLQSLEQVFFYRLFNDSQSLSDWIGTTVIITNKLGMFTYFPITPEIVSDGLPKIVFRFMKGMWAYAAQDSEGILEIEDEVVNTEKECHEREESATEQKLTKIAKKMAGGNKGASLEPLKNALIDMVDEGPIQKELKDLDMSKNDIISNALAAIKNTSIDINKTSSKSAPKTPQPMKKKFMKNDIDDAIDALDDAVSDDDDRSRKTDKNDDEDILLGDSDTDEKEDETEKEIEELYEKTSNAVRNSRLPERTPEVIRRVKVLKKKSEKVQMDGKNGKTLKELLDDFEKISIDVDEIPARGVMNKSVKYPTGQAFNRSYYNKQFDRDIAMMMKQFSEAPEINMIVTNITKKDISNTLNALIKYTFDFVDEFGNKHKVAYNIPKLVDNKFFLVDGNKKMLTGQIASIPVVKINPDEVRITTAFNQMHIYRAGQAFDPKLEILKKLIKKFPGNGTYGLSFKSGDSYDTNLKYNTTLEYDKLSETFYSIVIQSSDKKKSVSFIFNQRDIRHMFEDLNIAYVEKPGLMPIGITEDKTIIYIDVNTGMDTQTKKNTICDLILATIRQYVTMGDLEKVIKRLTVPKKYMYSKVHYLGRLLSFGVFLGYLFGLSELLKEMGVKYTFEKEPLPKENALKQNMIRFKDGFLYYDIHPVRHSLILNGLIHDISTENFTLKEMDEENPYLLAFDEMFQTRHFAKGFKDGKSWLIDFKTAQVMRTLNLPDTFLPMMLYANSLLEDNTVVDPKTTDVNRIRNLELIPCVFMYKSLTQTYRTFKHRYTSKSTMFVNENDIIKKMNDSGLFRDYDTLNPIREIETEGSLTFKGPGGCKQTDAYTLSRRAYDKSMVGVFAASSPDGPDIGITKYMSMNPRISDVLGFVKSGKTDNPEEIDFGNIGSVAELLVPYAIDHDDARRLGMVGKESKHVMAAMDTDPLLIGNGVEKTVPYMTSNDFITFAKKDGSVLQIDKKNGVAIVEYNDGERESIDIQDHIHKDGGMGFYVVSRKTFDLQEGDKFKKFDVLAKNPSYFSTENGKNAPEFNPGVLANVAVVMSSTTFEDSAVITEKLAKRMSTEVVMLKKVVLGAKANIFQSTKVGDNVIAGQALMIYEDELDDPEINKIVNQASTKDLKALEDLVKQTPHSKVTGTIQDIKVYYTVPVSEMSDSVRKFVEGHNNRIRDRVKVIAQAGAKNPNEISTDYIGVTPPSSDNKIKGTYCPQGKVLVEYYTKYIDQPNSGDKICFFASMKCVLCRTLAQNLAPYPIKRKDDKIDAILNPISIQARQVTSILHMLFGNKCVWGLKEQVRKLFNEYAEDERK